jgi:two-component system sensor histidine kinase UhpB
LGGSGCDILIMMVAGVEIVPRIKERIVRLSIFRRIIIGNALIIVIGAVIGTLVTRYLAIRAADISLILVFATVGIALSVVTNSLIVGAALRPLTELRQRVDAVTSAQGDVRAEEFAQADPNLYQLANAVENLIAQLNHHNRQLHKLSEQVINAQEDERRRIARSLHDDTGQSLTTLIINLERLQSKVPSEQEQLIGMLAEAHQIASRSLTGLRKIILGLRPSILDDLGLVPAIRWYARSQLEEAGIRVDVIVPEEELPLPTRTATTLFRITQEAVNNIVRHSQAEQVIISLLHEREAVILRIEDNGRGFNLNGEDQDGPSGQKWGLIGIRERVELIGGKLLIHSDMGSGTSLDVTVPLNPSDKEAHHE